MPVAAPRRPAGRLSSIKDRTRGPPRTRPPPAKPAETAKTCPKCHGTNLEESDGQLVCTLCFIVVSEQNIVSEVTFEEQSGGRATVQGGTVNENARHAKTLGSAAFRKVGGERNSFADVINSARQVLTRICPKLGIEDHVVIQAENIWTLASNISFSTGRKNDECIAACLYAACRRQRDNKILLMDIAELLAINVFRLGEVYKDLCKLLYLNDETVGHQFLQELEPLIKKYCDKLGFAEKTKAVAEDALKIIRRMNRDWIVAGRHPAGLCSACIILAARMNNFNRSVRELVYVSKVADVTIAKRVEEFRRTKSSALTVDKFREFANRIKHQHDPPSLFITEDRERLFNNKKRKREEHLRLQTIERESQTRQSQQPIVIPDDDASSRLSSVESDVDAGESMESLKKRQRLEVPNKPVSPPATQEASGTASAQVENDGAEEMQPTPPTTQEPASAVSAQTQAQANIPTQEMQPTPPAAQETAKRKRDDGDDDATSTPPQDGGANKRPRTDATPPAATQQERRIDSDGFAIPALPASAVPVVPVVPAMAGSGAQIPTTSMDGSPVLGARASPTPPPPGPSARSTPAPSEAGESTVGDMAGPKKRGRKKFEPPTIDLSQEELDVENYLELEIEKYLDDGDVQDSQSEVEKLKENELYEQELERSKMIAADQLKLQKEKNKERREALGHAYDDDEEDLEKLFENDMEVEFCILKPHEVKIKEQIWVAHNEDWLRKQAEKDMMAQVAKTTGGSTRGRKRKDGKPSGRGRKKKGKMGDGTLLSEAGTPVETPADAAELMLRTHNPSTNIDFSILKQVLKPRDGTPSSTQTTSAENTRQATPASVDGRSPAPSEITAEEGAAQSPAASDEEDYDQLEEAEPGSAWDGINDEPRYGDDGEEDAAAFLRSKMGPAAAVEEDEFGAVDNYDSGSGDEYG